MMALFIRKGVYKRNVLFFLLKIITMFRMYRILILKMINHCFVMLMFV